MISNQHPIRDIEAPHQPSSTVFSFLLGLALILGASSVAASVFLGYQFFLANQRIQAIEENLNADSSSNSKRIVGLNQQLENLNKLVQVQSSQLSKTDESLTNTKKDFLQTQKVQDDLKKELSQFRAEQNDKSLLKIGIDTPQDIGHGFLVTHLRAEPSSTGMTLSGNIINGAAIEHTDVSFRVTMGEQSQLLRIDRIEPDGIGSFEIDFPNQRIAEANDCRIDYETSHINLSRELSQSENQTWGIRIERSVN